MVKFNWENGLLSVLIICVLHALEWILPSTKHWVLVLTLGFVLGVGVTIALTLSKHPADREDKWMGMWTFLFPSLLLIVPYNMTYKNGRYDIEDVPLGTFWFVCLGLPVFVYAGLWIFTSWSVGALITAAWVAWLAQVFVATGPDSRVAARRSAARA